MLPRQTGAKLGAWKRVVQSDYFCVGQPRGPGALARDLLLCALILEVQL
jgi:hypothetical protein